MDQERLKAVKEAVDNAISVVEEIPEQYREEALAPVLRALLDTSLPTAVGSAKSHKVPGGKTEPANRAHPGAETFAPWENQLLSKLPEPHVVADGSRAQQAVWAIVRLRQKGETADRSSINKIIKHELGVTPQDLNNTSRTLGTIVPRFATREKEGRGYSYRPSRHALEVFAM